jgi:predicted secreted protein
MGGVFSQAHPHEQLRLIGNPGALPAFAERRSAVNDDLSFEVLLCGEYEKLLNDCQHALDRWNDRSEAVRQRHQTGEETGRELLRLQARFAKAYTVLQRHVQRCERCELAARLSCCVNEANVHSLVTTAN